MHQWAHHTCFRDLLPLIIIIFMITITTTIRELNLSTRTPESTNFLHHTANRYGIRATKLYKMKARLTTRKRPSFSNFSHTFPFPPPFFNHLTFPHFYPHLLPIFYFFPLPLPFPRSKLLVITHRCIALLLERGNITSCSACALFLYGSTTLIFAPYLYTGYLREAHRPACSLLPPWELAAPRPCTQSLEASTHRRGHSDR